MRDLIVRGMSGLGDNLHQRPLIRELMKASRVWLKTPWPNVYHDMVGPGLHLLPPETQLRTQLKNADRQAALYSRSRAASHTRQIQISYTPDAVRGLGSVLGAMMHLLGMHARSANFHLPVPQGWHDKLTPWLARWNPSKPILFYRPLNERSEWKGCSARNPDFEAYAALVESIADRFFVVSVADLEPEKEWLVGRQIKADVECHAGELDFETIAALVERSALVYTSPGFALILAQAVGTPVVGVFGGYEDACSFSAGAHYAPFLPIEPIKPCTCFQHTHACDKRIDGAAALRRLEEFVDEVCTPAEAEPHRQELSCAA